MKSLDAWLKHFHKLFAIERERRGTLLRCEPLESHLVPTIASRGSALLALAGQSYSGVVGTFTPASGTTSTDYQATILWGDGQESAASIDSSYNVSGSHVFNAAGDYPVAFQVVNTLDNSTGVGVTLGLVENVTEPAAFQVAGSTSLSQSATTTQSGADSSGSFSLQESGTLTYTVSLPEIPATLAA